MKIFLLKKPTKKHIGYGAKNIILNATEPMAYNAILPIIESLIEDNRCKTLAFVTSEQAKIKFDSILKKKNLRFRFQEIIIKKRGRKNTTNIIGHNWINALSKFGCDKFDIAIATIDWQSDKYSLFFVAKKRLGVKKMFLLQQSVTALCARSSLLKKYFTGTRAGSVDGVFYQDTFSQNITLGCLPNIPRHIAIISGPILTDVHSGPKIKQLRNSSKKKLGIKTNEFAILYLGDADKNYHKIDKAIDIDMNSKTLLLTIEATIQVASILPKKNLVFLVRSHPRGRYKEKAVIKKIKHILPNNLKIKYVRDDKISFEETMLSANVLVSIGSAENFLASQNGISAVFLAYKSASQNKKLGAYLLGKVLGRNAHMLFKDNNALTVASSPSEFTQILSKIVTGRHTRAPRVNKKEKAIDIILNRVFN